MLLLVFAKSYGMSLPASLLLHHCITVAALLLLRYCCQDVHRLHYFMASAIWLKLFNKVFPGGICMPYSGIVMR